MTIILCVSVLCAAIVGLSIYFWMPIGLKIDKSKVLKHQTDVVFYDRNTGYGRYRALGKVDGEGNLTDEPFKILTFTDMHLDTYRKKGGDTISHMLDAVHAEQPDLIIFTGDIVTSSTNWLRARQFADMMENLGIYWCPILGNHEGDNWTALTREKYLKLWSSYAYCLMENDPDAVAAQVWGNGNYVVNLLKSGGEVRKSLIFLDSGNEISQEDAKKYNVSGGYDYLKPSQIEWYRGVVANLNAYEQTEPVTSLMYIHIPLPEYADAQAIVQSENRTPGQTASDGTEYIFGNAYESVACSRHNSGMFDAILQGGSTQAVFCGHDHINNTIIRYQGILLVYNQKSGYSSYDLKTKGLGEPNQGYTVTVVRHNGMFDLSNVLY
jgi:predicted MPP superfamily phosphohydrolase